MPSLARRWRRTGKGSFFLRRSSSYLQGIKYGLSTDPSPTQCASYKWAEEEEEEGEGGGGGGQTVEIREQHDKDDETQSQFELLYNQAHK